MAPLTLRQLRRHLHHLLAVLQQRDGQRVAVAAGSFQGKAAGRGQLSGPAAQRGMTGRIIGELGPGQRPAELVHGRDGQRGLVRVDPELHASSSFSRGTIGASRARPSVEIPAPIKRRVSP